MAAPNITPVSDVLGAEIVGLDLRQPLNPEQKTMLLDAFHRYQVLVVRDQQLSPQEQILFSGNLGELEHPGNAEYTIPEAPLVLILSNGMEDGKPLGVIDAGDYWHSDSSHREIPSRATLLFSVKNPSRGGDTLFANMYLAYETLPQAMKDRIEGLKGIHAGSKLKNKRVTVSSRRPGAQEFYESRVDRPSVLQPMVRTHPATGRKALFISPRFTIGIEGMAEAEADLLLDELFAHQLKPDFQYRHKWRDGDLVIWDNRCLIHLAGGGYRYPDVRIMHRTVIAGEPAY